MNPGARWPGIQLRQVAINQDRHRMARLLLEIKAELLGIHGNGI